MSNIYNGEIITSNILNGEIVTNDKDNVLFFIHNAINDLNYRNEVVTLEHFYNIDKPNFYRVILKNNKYIDIFYNTKYIEGGEHYMHYITYDDLKESFKIILNGFNNSITDYDSDDTVENDDPYDSSENNDGDPYDSSGGSNLLYKKKYLKYKSKYLTLKHMEK